MSLGSLRSFNEELLLDGRGGSREEPMEVVALAGASFSSVP